MQKLLARQLRKCFNDDVPTTSAFQAFVQLIKETYQSVEEERLLSERSMSLASEELFERNTALHENIRHLKEVSAALQEQTVISETLLRIGKTIAAELTTQRVAMCVTEELSNAVGAMWGVFSFADSDDAVLQALPPVISGNVPEHIASSLGVRLHGSLLPSKDFAGIVPTKQRSGDRSPSIMVAPVTSRNGERLGTLLLGSEKHDAFTPQHECVLRGVASQAAISIDNARLYKHATEAGERLAYQAQHDALTGLPNRLLFRDRLERCIERLKRRDNYHFAVLFVDLDGFKHVNDTLGHECGDQLLVQVSERLHTSLRGVDTVCKLGMENTVARMGGDEFTILLEDLDEPASASRVGQRIVDLICQPFELHGKDVSISASVGVCHSGIDAKTPDEFLRHADTAMYLAKTGGKSKFVVFSQDNCNEVMERLRIEQDVAHAIDRGEMSVVYQPILDIRTRSCVGFESLIRWERAGACVLPDEFIHIAEQTGAIVPIGRWILDEAVGQLARWRNENPNLAPLSISVNVSSRQLSDATLVNYVQDVLKKHDLPARNLRLEITESMMIEDKDRCVEIMTQLRALGVAVYLDDFGTGYSSLSYLHRFPLDGLKIDRSFIHNIAARKDALAVLQAIMSLAHNLDIKVVAEGLELPEQVALMQFLDCDFGQGYIFARPLLRDDAALFAAACPQLVRSA